LQKKERTSLSSWNGEKKKEIPNGGVSSISGKKKPTTCNEGEKSFFWGKEEKEKEE